MGEGGGDGTTGDSADPLPPAFTIETSTCAAPVALGWTLLVPPTELGEWSDTVFQSIEAGAVAIIPSGSGAIIIWEDYYAELHALAVGEAELDPADFPMVSDSAAFTLLDLDQDGEDELLAFGGPEFTLFTDLPRSFASETVTMPDGLSPRDISPAYIDDTEQIDLFISFTHNESPPPSRVWHDPGIAFTGAAQEISDPGAGWGRTFDTTLLDVNGDNRPDAYICNDFGRETAPNAFYANSGGDFVSAGDPSGLGVVSNCMGSGWGDIDGDGLLDLALGDAERLWLLVDVPDFGFVDVTATSGMPNLDGHQMLWGLSITDLDNDGRNDLILPTSWFWDGDAEPWPLWIGLQNEDGTFTEAGASLGFPQEADTRTVVPFDINGDGVLDLIVGDGQRSPWVFLSNGCTDGNWLELGGPEGTRVVVEAGGRSFVGLITTEASFKSAKPRGTHVGLGNMDTVDRITWYPPWREPLTLEGPIPARSLITWSGD
jgi:hypothetical protein